MPHTPTEQLVKMANQIGEFFEAQSLSEPIHGPQALAAHLKLFWAPSMRENLIEAYDKGEAPGLTPAVEAAIRQHRTSLLRTSAHLPEENALAFPQGGGDAG